MPFNAQEILGSKGKQNPYPKPKILKKEPDFDKFRPSFNDLLMKVKGA
jgi:hypothetical protein